MVQSLRVLSVAASVMIGAASAFTPANSALSFGITQSRPLSPTPLQAAATVLDAPTTSSSGGLGSNSIILDRPTTIERTKQDSNKHNTNSDMIPNGEWLLRIYNDNINTREYVAVCLVQVTGLCESRAYYTMQQAHQHGIAKVGEYDQEVAECYEEQLIERGIVCDVVMEGQ